MQSIENCPVGSVPRSRAAMRERSAGQISGERYIDVNASCTKAGISRTTLYKLRNCDPTFPKSIRIGTKRLFRESAIEAWLAQREAA